MSVFPFFRTGSLLIIYITLKLSERSFMGLCYSNILTTSFCIDKACETHAIVSFRMQMREALISAENDVSIVFIGQV